MLCERTNLREEADNELRLLIGGDAHVRSFDNTFGSWLADLASIIRKQRFSTASKTSAPKEIEKLHLQTAVAGVARSFLLAHDNTGVTVALDSSCRGAELRFLRALDITQEGKKPKHHRRAVIYTDTNGRPIAFRKQVGYNTVLLLEDIDNQLNLLPGTIIEFGKSDEGRAAENDPLLTKTRNPCLRIATFPLLAAGVPVILDRPSTFSFEINHGSSLGFEPPDYDGGPLGPYAAKVDRTDLSDIRKSVQDIIEAA